MAQEFSPSPPELDFARAALQEDAFAEDITCEVLKKIFKGKSPRREFLLVAKEPGVFSGEAWVWALAQVAEIEITRCAHESERFQKGEAVVEGQGNAWRILSAERTLLNELQYLCGIATRTAKFVAKIEQGFLGADRPGIYHTRKTLALHRPFALQAVLAGGGKLHRKNLGDRILLKENHKYLALEENLAFGDLVRAVVEASPHAALIEVENPDEAGTAYRAGARHLLLDNFSPEMIRETLKLWPRNDCVVEVSGGLKFENLENYFIPGITRLSVGALTHSVKAVDISLDWTDRGRT